jgi:hypothetical protein
MAVAIAAVAMAAVEGGINNNAMNESIEYLRKILNNKIVFFISKFPYFPSSEVKTIYNNSVENNVNWLLQHIIKYDMKQHNNLIKALAAHRYGIEWYNQQIISMLNIGEAIQKLNDNSITTQPIIIAFTSLITEMGNRGLWVI